MLPNRVPLSPGGYKHAIRKIKDTLMGSSAWPATLRAIHRRVMSCKLAVETTPGSDP